MKIHSFNEWDRLREIVVGTATNANWPATDPAFRAQQHTTTWTDTPLPIGPVPDWIVNETNEDLAHLSDTLTALGVTVHRPTDLDFIQRDGMYNYCPRDRLLIAGNVVVDPAMQFACRDWEIEALDFVTQNNTVISMPRDSGMVLDAANICRLGDSWLYLESASGTRSAAVWLQAQFPDINIELCNFYAGVHIDSTVSALRDGVVVLNASRVTEDNCPRVFEKWKKIWVHDCTAQGFYQYPYASKWIGLNMLSIDSNTVIVDSAQTDLIQQLEQNGFTVIPQTLRHSRTLGGGFHCVTLDTWRQNDS
jgi:N-dimethylarginine dimethylaminohydrolase